MDPRLLSHVIALGVTDMVDQNNSDERFAWSIAINAVTRAFVETKTLSDWLALFERDVVYWRKGNAPWVKPELIPAYQRAFEALWAHLRLVLDDTRIIA